MNVVLSVAGLRASVSVRHDPGFRGGKAICGGPCRLAFRLLAAAKDLHHLLGHQLSERFISQKSPKHHKDEGLDVGLSFPAS
ncbi:MAG TPA: hypothetical protein PKA16_04845 [Ottowia sp.]|uniref:hypothetical protein n=1 Tax=Ottowia sp. TaxID=1898956 RepID=UPI002BCA4DAC|nr:hypothetical protein [Ottowia sp.]HMN20701.1 hypothetical protein [Ottowia sp.]